MSWFVTGITDPNQTSGTVTPYIFQAADEAAAEKQIGGPPLAGPFATQAQAQAWVKAHPGQFGPGKTGAKPYNDFIGAGTPGLKNPLTGWTHNIEQWLIRGFEMLLGLGLIIVAVAKLASDTPAGRAAAKIATKAAIL